jgi:hypothetical protein
MLSAVVSRGQSGEMIPIAMRSFHPMIVWSTFMETTATMVWMRLPLSTTCRDVVPEMSILVPFAALRQMDVAVISHLCLFAVLRLMRNRPRVSEYLEPERRLPDWLQVQEQRRCRPSDLIDVADRLRDCVAAFEKLPLPKVFPDLRALL